MPTSPLSITQGPFLGFQPVELLQTPPEGVQIQGSRAWPALGRGEARH